MQTANFHPLLSVSVQKKTQKDWRQETVQKNIKVALTTYLSVIFTDKRRIAVLENLEKRPDGII